MQTGGLNNTDRTVPVNNQEKQGSKEQQNSNFYGFDAQSLNNTQNYMEQTDSGCVEPKPESQMRVMERPVRSLSEQKK